MIAENKAGLTVTTPSDLEIVMTRVFDAPRELVFEAHSSCEHVKQWWGRTGSTLRICDMDFRPGGAWRFVERQSDGAEYAFRGEYREVVAPERIVQTFEFEGMPGHISVDTMALVEEDGKTTMTSTSVFDSVEDRDAMLQSGMEEGANETWDRLAAYLEQRSAASDRELVFTRVLDAPRELVWSAWTDSEHVAQWWGPNGFATTTEHMDVRPGGVWRFVMHGPDGVDYQNRIEYSEVVQPERLAYVHGGGEGEPEFHVTVTFEDQGGKTRLTMRSVFPTAADLERVVREFGAVDGANQTLDRLAAYLRKM